MKNLATIAIATVLAGATIGATQPPPRQIIVNSTLESRNALAAVGSDLSYHLKQMDSWPRRSGVAEGIAVVRFSRTADGRASNVVLYHREGGGDVARMAVRAVSLLKGLERLPDGAGAGQVYQANIVFASDEGSFRTISQRLARFEAQRLASSPQEHKVLALTASNTNLS